MSIESWKEEFYPVTASELVDLIYNEIPDAGDVEMLLVKNSLRKWRGMTKDNLNRHDVRGRSTMLDEGFGGGGKYIALGAASCSLCKMANSVCQDCLLYQYIDKPEATDEQEWKEGACDEQWQEWSRNLNPVPMIGLLEELLREVGGSDVSN